MPCGAAAYMLFPFFQLLVDQSAQILGRVVVVTVRQQLVENVVACDGVFVCGHNVSIFPAAKIRLIHETYFRTDKPSILFVKFRIRHVCLPWTMTRFGA